MQKLPLSLGQNKLIDCIFEIRFNEESKAEVLFANAYNLLSEEGFSYTKTPHADLPVELLKTEPSLTYAAFYKFEKENFNVVIGPKVLGITITSPYNGWKEFQAFIADKLEKFEIFFTERSIQQVSMRYINFFEDLNIFDYINIKIEDDFLCNKYTTLPKKAFRTRMGCGDMELSLQIDNAASLNQKLNENPMNGSIIDIDIFDRNVKDKNEIIEKSEKLHLLMKETFFKIIKEEYVIENFEPKYEEI